MTASSERRGAGGRVGLIARNALSILTSDAAGRATTFALYVLVARHLGTQAFGQFSLALTFFYASQVVAVAGLKTLLTREVAKRPDRVSDYLRGGSLIVVVASCASLAGLSVLVRALGYAADTASVILLLALGLLPYALSQVCEGIFQGLERMSYIAYANVGVNALKIGVALTLLASGRGLVALTLLLVGAHCAVAAVEWWLMLRRIPLPPSQAGTAFALSLARTTRPFLGIEGLVAVMSSANIVLLSKLAGEREVGLYSAAAQLMVPVGLVIGSAILSVFPDMAARYDADPRGLRTVTAGIFGVLFALVIPAAVGLFALAGPVLLLLYGETSFLAASAVLRIMVWNVVLLCMTAVLGQVLLAASRERTNFAITAIDAAASVVLGVVLIARFGLAGAATAALLVRLIDFVLHYVPVSKLVPDLSLARLMWKPALAGACLAGALALLADRSVLVAVVSGAAVYAIALAGLEMATTGSVLGALAHKRTTAAE